MSSSSVASADEMRRRRRRKFSLPLCLSARSSLLSLFLSQCGKMINLNLISVARRKKMSFLRGRSFPSFSVHLRLHSLSLPLKTKSKREDASPNVISPDSIVAKPIRNVVHVRCLCSIERFRRLCSSIVAEILRLVEPKLVG